MRHSPRLGIGSLLAVCLVACARDIAAPPHVPTGGRALTSGGVAPTGADLQISGSANPGSPTEGVAFAYTFQVKNAGPDSATGTTFTDVLPPGMIYQGAQVNDALIICPQSGQTVTCNLGTIKSGAQATLLLLATPPMAVVTDTSIATVTSLVSDPKATNNVVNVVTRVVAPNGGGGKVVPTQAVAFSSLPADFSTGGYVFAGGPSGVAFPFISAATGTWNAVTVAMHGNGTPGRAGFWLYADDPNNPGHPGALISGEVIGPIPALNDGSYTVISVPTLSAPLLTAGKQYWLFGFGAAGESSAQWDLTANLQLTSPVAEGPPGSTPFLVPGTGLGRMAAFIIGVVQ